MSNTQFNAGSHSQPLGDAKAGISDDLDALTAAAAAAAGKQVFQARGCASCHGGSGFTASAANNPVDIKTIDADSGNRPTGRYPASTSRRCATSSARMPASP
jgi:mono/diheme cytochrome c family protein